MGRKLLKVTYANKYCKAVDRKCMLWPTVKMRGKSRELIFYQENQLRKTPGSFFKEALLSFQHLLGPQFQVNSKPSGWSDLVRMEKDCLQIIARTGWGKAAKWKAEKIWAWKCSVWEMMIWWHGKPFCGYNKMLSTSTLLLTFHSLGWKNCVYLMCPEVQTLLWTHFLIFILPLSSETDFDIQTSLMKFDGLFPCFHADLGPHSRLCCSLPENEHSQLRLYHLQVFPWSQLETIGIEKTGKLEKILWCILPARCWMVPGTQTTSLGATLFFRQNPDVDGRAQSELPVWMCLPKFMHLRLSQWVTVGIWSLVKSNELIRTVLKNGLMPWWEWICWEFCFLSMMPVLAWTFTTL